MLRLTSSCVSVGVLLPVAATPAADEDVDDLVITGQRPPNSSIVRLYSFNNGGQTTSAYTDFPATNGNLDISSM